MLRRCADHRPVAVGAEQRAVGTEQLIGKTLASSLVLDSDVVFHSSKFQSFNLLAMASLEKLVKTIDQLRGFENVTATLDAGSVKKKEIRLLLSNLVDLNCNASVQNHKDFVSYISPSIDTLIRLFDSKDSDIRLASDEGLYKVIKVSILYLFKFQQCK